MPPGAWTKRVSRSVSALLFASACWAPEVFANFRSAPAGSAPAGASFVPAALPPGDAGAASLSFQPLDLPPGAAPALAAPAESLPPAASPVSPLLSAELGAALSPALSPVLSAPIRASPNAASDQPPFSSARPALPSPAAEAREAAQDGREDLPPNRGRLEALSAASDPAALWTGARSFRAPEASALPDAGGPQEAASAGDAPGRLAAPLERPAGHPPVAVPSPGWSRSARDWLLYQWINLSSLGWYTFPRLIERWEELRAAIKSSEGLRRAVKDFRGFFIAHRVLGSTGSYSPLGFRVAANGIVVQDAWDIYDRYFHAGPEAREAFARFISRAERFNPNRRSTQFRKIVFHALREGSVKEPSRLGEFFDTLATEEAAGRLKAFQREHQERILGTLDRAVRETLLEINAGRPRGRRIVAALLFGSMANGAAGPGSDLDVQAISEDGRAGYNEIFYKKLKARWAAYGMSDTPISGFQYALPLSRGLITRLHREPYRIISPYPEVIEALVRPPEEAPEPVSRIRTLRGRIFQALYTRFLYLVLAVYETWYSGRAPHQG